MTSKKQTKANIENAKKGGVKTPEGKAASSKNSLKHGALSNFLFENEHPLFNEIRAGLVDKYQPAGIIEIFLLDRIAMRIIQSYRLNLASFELWQGANDPTVVYSTLENPFEEVHEGYTPEVDVKSMTVLAQIFNRYEKSIENQILKLKKALT